MNDPVAHVMTMLCNVVRTLPVGTNLAVLHLLVESTHILKLT